MMKLLISFLILTASLSGFASSSDSETIRVGDKVHYVYTTGAGTQMGFRWSVVGFDETTGSYSTKFQTEFMGPKQEEMIFRATYSKDKVSALGSTKEIYNNCQGLGGEYQMINTPKGDLSVCHLTDKFQKERWVSKDIRCSDAKMNVSDSTGATYLLTVRSYNCRN